MNTTNRYYYFVTRDGNYCLLRVCKIEGQTVWFIAGLIERINGEWYQIADSKGLLDQPTLIHS